MLALHKPLPLPDATEGQVHTVECVDCRGCGGNDEDGECASCKGMGKVDLIVDAHTCLCDACTFGYWVDLGDGAPKFRFKELGDAMRVAPPEGRAIITQRKVRTERAHGPVFS